MNNTSSPSFAGATVSGATSVGSLVATGAAQVGSFICNGTTSLVGANMTGDLDINSTSPTQITLLYPAYASVYLRNYQGSLYIYHGSSSNQPYTLWDGSGNLSLANNASLNILGTGLLKMAGNLLAAPNPAQAVTPANAIYYDRHIRSKSFYYEEDFLGLSAPPTNYAITGATISYLGSQGIISMSTAASTPSYAALGWSNGNNYFTWSNFAFDFEMFVNVPAVSSNYVLMFGMQSNAIGSGLPSLTGFTGVMFYQNAGAWYILVGSGSASTTAALTGFSPGAGTSHVFRVSATISGINAVFEQLHRWDAVHNCAELRLQFRRVRGLALYRHREHRRNCADHQDRLHTLLGARAN